MTLGEKLIEFRKKDNLTQEKLSEKLGISRQTLLNWESDNTTPDIVQAKKIARLFKISLDDLLDNNTEVECKQKKGVLNNLIACNCYLDIESNDYRLNYSTLVKVIDVQENFLKIELKSKKEIITKLIDKKLINSIKVVENLDGDL